MNRLKLLREEKQLVQSDVAKYLNITVASYSYYENEKRDMSPDIIIKLAEYFGVTTDYLLGKSDIRNQDNNVFPTPDNAVPIPVVGKISAGLPILASENIDRYEFAPSSLINKNFNYFYLTVTGDSMNRKFNDGDIVLVQQQSDLENDEIGVFLIDDEATVKKYKTQNDLIILEPMSNNPIHTVQIYNPKEKSIKIIGKVISYQGKI
jgi:repressor LexA